MKARHKRFGFLAVGLVALGLAGWLVLNALDNNLSYFFSPTEVAQNQAPENHVFRLGGLVEEGSLKRLQGVDVEFTVTDKANSVRVVYSGILPDLFEEGQGVIAQGRMGTNGTFNAEEVLAKHDENYMPPEVADALNKAHVEGVQQAAAEGQKL
ncbi:MAG: cytochrome c maturation protein CcmE [Chromatiales bacterium]|jgi:cytochrome c-type biogenesis protein CcmE